MVKNRDRNELLPGTLEMLILKTLMRSPMHGYGIAQYIKQVSEEVLHVEEGSLYPALQRLQVKGWVTSEWAQSDKNRKARFYKLTPLGRKQFFVEQANFDQMIKAIARVMKTA